MNCCRICFGESGLLQTGCNCKNGLEYIHLDCADTWYSDHMTITLFGKLKDPTLKVTYYVECEICKSPIGFSLCRAIYARYDKNVLPPKSSANDNIFLQNR